MPRFNGTGPTGQGSLTGKGMGPCSGGVRRGFGCRGYGLGTRSSYRSPKNQLDALNEEETLLTEELKAIKVEKEALSKII